MIRCLAISPGHIERESVMPPELVVAARQLIDGLAWFGLAIVMAMMGLELLARRRNAPPLGLLLTVRPMAPSARLEVEEILGDLMDRMSSEKRKLLADALDRADRAALVARTV